MGWGVHYFDRRLNRDCVSRAYPTRDDALHDLSRQNCEVRHISE